MVTSIEDLKKRAENAGFEFKKRITSEGETLHYGQCGAFKTMGYSNPANAVKAAIKSLDRRNLTEVQG